MVQICAEALIIVPLFVLTSVLGGLLSVGWAVLTLLYVLRLYVLSLFLA